MKCDGESGAVNCNGRAMSKAINQRGRTDSRAAFMNTSRGLSNSNHGHTDGGDKAFLRGSRREQRPAPAPQQIRDQMRLQHGGMRVGDAPDTPCLGQGQLMTSEENKIYSYKMTTELGKKEKTQSMKQVGFMIQGSWAARGSPLNEIDPNRIWEPEGRCDVPRGRICD